MLNDPMNPKKQTESEACCRHHPLMRTTGFYTEGLLLQMCSFSWKTWQSHRLCQHAISCEWSDFVSGRCLFWTTSGGLTVPCCRGSQRFQTFSSFVTARVWRGTDWTLSGLAAEESQWRWLLRELQAALEGERYEGIVRCTQSKDEGSRRGAFCMSLYWRSTKTSSLK